VAAVLLLISIGHRLPQLVSAGPDPGARKVSAIGIDLQSLSYRDQGFCDRWLSTDIGADLGIYR